MGCTSSKKINPLEKLKTGSLPEEFITSEIPKKPQLRKLSIFTIQNKLKLYHKNYKSKKSSNQYFQKDQKNKNKISKKQKKNKKIKYKINYIENKFLGSGSNGTVTRGYDKKNNLTIAIKKIFLGNSSIKEIERKKKKQKF